MFQKLLNLMSLSKPNYRIMVIGFGIIFVSVFPVYYLDYYPSLCLWKRFFGFSCPACGTTHALISFFHGNFIESLNYNKNIIILAPLLIFLFVKDFLKLIKEQI